MDDTRRKILMDELREAVGERDQLTAFIELLSVRLGIKASDVESAGTTDESSRTVNMSATPAASINEGQFYGFSATKAARAVLELFGSTRPMKTEALYDAISKGGVKIKNSGVLYRSLIRNEDFTRIGRGIWGLSEWYPTTKRGGRPSHNGEPPNDESSAGAGPEEGDPEGTQTT